VGLNLATILRESARSRPDKVAVISGAVRATYAELDAASDRFAAGLARRGLVAGDAVALQLPNLPQFVVAYFAILKAGCVVVPVNPL
jgi:long-chain acyl-CoA synthetase